MPSSRGCLIAEWSGSRLAGDDRVTTWPRRASLTRAAQRGLLAHLDARRDPGPSSLVKVRRRRLGRPPLLLPQEIQAIIDGCATWDDTAGEWRGNLRDRLFSLLAESGMRLGEVLGMAISDFVMGRGGTAYIEAALPISRSSRRRATRTGRG